METINDLYEEHELHKNMVKGIMARSCSECYKEHMAILKKSKDRINSPLTRLEAGMSY